MSTRFTIANMIEELRKSQDITPRQRESLREHVYKSCDFTIEEIRHINDLYEVISEITKLFERDFDAEANDRERQIDNNGETAASVQPNIAPKDNVSLPPVSLPSNGL